ncbi:MAG: alkaline phosphatase, partial [Enterobacteriaceae bacterium]
MNKKLLLLTASLFYLPAVSAVPLNEIPSNFAKNVIMLIPDGTSQNNITLMRWVYNDGKPLHLDTITSGLVRTHNSDAPIADSAPAASAMATGHKTQDKLISLRPGKADLYGAIAADERQAFAPLATVLEMAKQQGKATGLVATSEIMHATPAAYSAHVMHRKEYDNISEQQVYQNINVVFGGGKAFLEPQERKDQQNLLT